MKRKKITLIGAGSAVFTQGLVADLIQSQKPWQVALVDIDEEALATAAGLTRRMVEMKDADIEVEASTDRKEVLAGSDVVVTTISVGGRRSWLADVTIPRQYGVYQPVGDTVMPGGISRAMRMVPAMVAIARDVLRLCPQALFVNYSNPMTVNCWAVQKATGADVVGLCHGVFGVIRDLAEFIGVSPREVTGLGAGVNHFTWIYDLRWKGEDAWPLVRARLAEERGEPIADANARAALAAVGPKAEGAWLAKEDPFSWSLFDAYGAYPAVNDRHVLEFFPERFPNGDYYGRKLGLEAFDIDGVITRGDARFERMKAQAAGQAPIDERLFQRGPGEHEELLDMLDSMEHDARRVYSVNLPNRGAVPGLPDDAVVEIAASATGRGFRALQVLDLDPKLIAPLARKVAAHTITVEAALSGDFRTLVEAIVADGAVPDHTIAAKLAADLVAFHKPHLPQFA
jgi:alpha-galactosidase